MRDPETLKWRRWSTRATFNNIARQLELDLAATPATLETYRDIIERFNPKLANIGAGRWISMRCDIRYLLRYAGVPNVPTRSLPPLSEEWRALLERLSPSARWALGRFARYCSESAGSRPAR